MHDKSWKFEVNKVMNGANDVLSYSFNIVSEVLYYIVLYLCLCV